MLSHRRQELTCICVPLCSTLHAIRVGALAIWMHQPLKPVVVQKPARQIKIEHKVFRNETFSLWSAKSVIVECMHQAALMPLASKQMHDPSQTLQCAESYIQSRCNIINLAALAGYRTENECESCRQARVLRRCLWGRNIQSLWC